MKYSSFPVAAHSYFHISNKDEQFKKFVKDDSYMPTFVYRADFNAKLVQKRIKSVANDSKEFLNLQLVATGISLQNDAKAVESFRRQNVALFGAPKKSYVTAILCRMEQQVNTDTRKLWKETLHLIGEITPSNEAFEPSKEMFQKYRQYLKRYVKPFNSKDRSLAELIDSQLAAAGLKNKGWKVLVRHSSIHSLTNHKLKRIITGREYEPRTQRAKKRITVHEVYGHALRGQQTSYAESEGFAIFLEQLMSPVFKYRRSYRYLAGALGYGVTGKRMDFREVYEILWRLMVINSKYSESKAKRYAFDECYRVFRGGRPDIAGAVFLKDGIYFDANIRVWKMLMHKEISYNEFIDSIEGRRAVL